MSNPTLFESPAARVTLVLSALFSTTGVILVFLPRWLEGERGLAGAEIGAVLALAPLGRLFFGPAIALWADSVADRRTPLRVMATASLIAFAAFFFLAHDFWSLLLLGFLALALMQTITPLAEAAALRATAEGKISYGVARGIGSLAFIVASVSGGFLVSRFGLGAVVVWTLCALAFTLASTLAMRRDPPTHTHAPGGLFTRIAPLLRVRRYLLVILACGLIQSGHAFYYNFSTIIWRGQGISADVVGLLWAFAVAIEVAFLWSLGVIERRVSPEAMIVAGATGGVVRWIVMGFAPTGLILWPLQALHALSFAAAHVGAMRLIYRETPQNSAAMAQTLYSATSAGLLLGAATLASGWLYDAVGPNGYWAMAGIVAAGGVTGLFLLLPRAQFTKTS